MKCPICHKIGYCEKKHFEVDKYAVFKKGKVELSPAGMKKLGKDYLQKLRMKPKYRIKCQYCSEICERSQDKEKTTCYRCKRQRQIIGLEIRKYGEIRSTTDTDRDRIEERTNALAASP